MGYYVRTTRSDFRVKKEKFDAAYKALCELNQRDDLKDGGSYAGPGKVNANSPRPDGMSYHPAKWFSWMDADYPSKCKDLAEVLQQVGFEVYDDAEGNIEALSYDSKTGCEEVFLEALAPFVEKGSFINWTGEEGEQYRHDFDGTEMRTLLGTTVWTAIC